MIRRRKKKKRKNNKKKRTKETIITMLIIVNKKTRFDPFMFPSSVPWCFRGGHLMFPPPAHSCAWPSQVCTGGGNIIYPPRNYHGTGAGNIKGAKAATTALYQCPLPRHGLLHDASFRQCSSLVQILGGFLGAVPWSCFRQFRVQFLGYVSSVPWRMFGPWNFGNPSYH